MSIEEFKICLINDGLDTDTIDIIINCVEVMMQTEYDRGYDDGYDLAVYRYGPIYEND